LGPAPVYRVTCGGRAATRGARSFISLASLFPGLVNTYFEPAARLLRYRRNKLILEGFGT
jgi:hypothetical protein